jgi:hypothetical protein
MGILDVFNATEIKKENAELKENLQKITVENTELKTLMQRTGALGEIEIRKRVELLQAEELDFRDKIEKTKSGLIEEATRKTNELQKLDFQIVDKKNQIISIDDDLMLESFALYKPHFYFQTSDEYQQRLDRIREEQKNMIKSGTAALGNQNWTVNGSATDGKRMVNDMIKLVLRSFNNECDYCVDNVKFNNIDSHVKRIVSSFQALNKLGKLMQVSISGKYYDSKITELHLAYEYQKKKQEEKEEQRRLKEEMREQEKLEREIKLARERIAKERKHFSIAIEDLRSRISSSKNEAELKELVSKVEELEKQKSGLDQEEKQIDYREQNAKAGYVYVISNLGSFGENIFKIGMTRRLDPMDRIIELGDASVPFPFDVHALIFSDNAPELEAKIQNTFRQGQMNKVNNRKEFFKANINEIEKTLKMNYDKVVDFQKLYEAEQYRESLLMKI